MASFGEEEPPPPYSPSPDQESTVLADHTPDTSHTFDRIERHIEHAKHCHEIRRHGNNRFTIERMARAPSFPGERIEGQTIVSDGVSHTTLYAHNMRIATARFFELSDVYQIHIGSSYHPRESQWTHIEFTHGSLLHASSYEFKAASKSLAWKHSHGPHLFGGSGNWHLEDLADVGARAPRHREVTGYVPKIISGGQTIATFRATPCSWVHGRSPEYIVGHVKWTDEYDEGIELTALLTLIVALQQG